MSSHVIGQQATPLRQRHVSFIRQGLVGCQFTDATANWRIRVEALRAVLLWLPAATDLAFVRAEVAGLARWLNYAVPWPHISEADLRYNRPLLSSFVPDANGIQVLTDAHLDRAHDLSNWDITALGSGRNLVQAADLAPWYSQALPDPEVMQRARQDFGGMILTPEVIKANNPWSNGPDPA